MEKKNMINLGNKNQIWSLNFKNVLAIKDYYNQAISKVDDKSKKSQYILNETDKKIGIYGRNRTKIGKVYSKAFFGVDIQVVKESEEVILMIEDYSIMIVLPTRIFLENNFNKNKENTRYLFCYVYNQDTDEHSLTLKKQNDNINLLDIDRFVIDLNVA